MNSETGSAWDETEQAIERGADGRRVAREVQAAHVVAIEQAPLRRRGQFDDVRHAAAIEAADDIGERAR